MLLLFSCILRRRSQDGAVSVPPGTIFGQYRILGPIGAGGMATVYRAFQPSLTRDVALKLMAPHLSAEPRFQARFRREARVLARLEHPNIVPIFDFGEEGGQAFIVYRYIPGGTLADLGAPLPLSEVVRLLEPVATALDFAHGRGVIHRDIKPSNILLTGDRTPIVGDFGLAHLLDDEPAPGMAAGPLTQAGMRIGTPSYMAPEQVRGDPIDRAIDQYSLAVVAYELLTGRLPFSGDTPYATMLKHVHESPPPPSNVNSAVGPATERALLRALDKAPRRRFASCGEFIRALAASARESGSRDETIVIALPLPAVSGGAPAMPATEFVAPAPAAERAPATQAAPAVEPGPSGGEPPRRRRDRRRTIAIGATAASVVAAAVIAAILVSASGSKRTAQPTQAHQPSATRTVSATVPATVASAPASPGATLPATVLYSDLFRDAQKSKLESTPPGDAAHYHFTIANNEFVITVTDPNFQSVPEAHLPGTYDDATLAVDALLQGSVEAPFIVLGCHQPDNGDDGYRFAVDPQNQVFTLTRWTSGKEADLVPTNSAAPALVKGAVNRLALTCAGGTIAASINGMRVASVQDATFSSGRFWLGADWTTGKRGSLEAHFGNLIVTGAAAGMAPVLLANALSSAEDGLLGTDTSDTAPGRFTYAGGDYVVSKPRPQPPSTGWFLAEQFADTALTVDARLQGEIANRSIQLGCRAGDAGGYTLVVQPDGGAFQLLRDDGQRVTRLIDRTPSAAIHRGTEVNRISLSCRGPTLTVNINGQQVGQVQDSRYRSGRLSIGVGGENLSAEGHFRNLVVTQQ
jgi:predicted Ser/Thr protein kinase